MNVPSDITLVELAEIRALCDAPIDLYLEAPDAMGGVVRGHELGEIATCCRSALREIRIA